MQHITHASTGAQIHSEYKQTALSHTHLSRTRAYIHSVTHTLTHAYNMHSHSQTHIMQSSTHTSGGAQSSMERRETQEHARKVRGRGEKEKEKKRGNREQEEVTHTLTHTYNMRSHSQTHMKQSCTHTSGVELSSGRDVRNKNM